MGEAVHAADDGEELDPGSLPDPEESGVDNRGPRAPQLTRLGRYRLVREIASGGMASVNLAVTEGLDKLVALKMIHPHLAQEEAFVHMFLDEARIASSISHRNVCNTFDFGEAEGRYYIAMDYLAGHSLRDLIYRLRRFASDGEPKRISAYMAYVLAEACEGLHAAHELRNSHGELLEVVHRDVSPHNLFVTYDGNVSVVDFGIARAADRLQHTATGVLKGKFSYMAPEQVRQQKVDRRADIWSLGVCLWESVTLERLFVRSSQADTLMSVMMDKIRPPSEVRPGLHPGLDAVIMKALSRNPAQRYATAREMGRDLMQVVRDGMVVGPVEIEHWLERLFGREREEARKLTRQAKQAALESSWSEGTPSGLPRVPTRSGMLPRVPSAARSEPGSQVSTPSAAVALVRVDESPGLRKGKVALAALAGLAIAVVSSWGLDWVTRVPPPANPAPSRFGIAVPAAVVVAAAPEIAAAPPPVPAAAPPAVASAGPSVTPSRAAPAWRGAARTPGAKPKPALATAPEIAPSVAAPVEVPAAPAPVVPPAPAPAPVAAPAEASGAAITAHAAAPARVLPVLPAPGPQRLEAVATFGSFEVSGSLGPGAVARMMGRATPLVHTCYADAAQRAGRNDFSPLAVSFSIDEMGALRGVESGSHPLPGLARCVGDSLKRIRSENKPDIGTVRVRLQVTFRQR